MIAATPNVLAASGDKADIQPRDQASNIIRKPTKTKPNEDRLLAGCNSVAPVLGISQKHLVSVQVAAAKRDQSGPRSMSNAIVPAADTAVSSSAKNSFPEMPVTA